MEKKHSVKIVTSLVTALLNMTLCLCIYFVFTKNSLFAAYLILILNFTLYILTNLKCPLKTYVIRLHNLISMNIFFTIKDHTFSTFYNCKEKAENK